KPAAKKAPRRRKKVAETAAPEPVAPDPVAPEPAASAPAAESAEKAEPVVTSSVAEAAEEPEAETKPRKAGWWQRKGFF
ncbi:MAG: hypothetical protein ABJH70_16670, partial [Nitratireductor sp.]